jgi:nitrate/nitrite transporter NarK
MSDAQGSGRTGSGPTSAVLVATSFLALFAIVGLCLYGLPFYYDFYVRELHWTRGQVTLGNTIGKVLVGPLFGFAVGWLIDRIGPRRPMIAGVLLAVVALVGISSINTLAAFYLFYVCNALAYVLAGPLPNQVLLSRHFGAGAGRGRAMGIAYLGIGLGGYVATKLSGFLVEGVGWRTSMRVVAALVVVTGLPLILRLRDSKPASAPQPGAAPASMGGVVRSPAFYLLLVGSMASVGAVGAAYQNLALFLKIDQHMTQPQAANIAGWVLLVSLIARPGAGWLADRLGAKRVMLIVYALVFTAMLMLVALPAGRAAYAFAVVFGLGLGGEYLIIPLMAASLFGTATLGRVMGIVLTADGIAEATFPFLVARLRDSTGTYVLSFKILAVLAAVGALAIALLPGRKTTGAPQVATRAAASAGS